MVDLFLFVFEKRLKFSFECLFDSQFLELDLTDDLVAEVFECLVEFSLDLGLLIDYLVELRGEVGDARKVLDNFRRENGVYHSD